MLMATAGEEKCQLEGIPNNARRHHRTSLLQRLKSQLLFQPKSIQLLVIGLCICLMISLLVICSIASIKSVPISLYPENTSTPTVSPRKPITLFVHLHKSGGTIVVESFKQSNNYKLFEPNAGGNPQRFDNKTNQYWDIYFGAFEGQRLGEWIQQLNDNQTTFIAMESHFFKAEPVDTFKQMKESKQFDLLTMIRDPLTRIISNYFYDVNGKSYDLSGLDQFSNLDDKLKWFCENTEPVFNHNNYYVRFLNGILEQTVEIQEFHLDRAKKRLAQFDAVGILEFKHTWDVIENRYGIKLKNLGKVNEHRTEHQNPTSAFAKWFKEKNKMDFQLYDYAVQISQIRTTV